MIWCTISLQNCRLCYGRPVSSSSIPVCGRQLLPSLVFLFWVTHFHMHKLDSKRAIFAVNFAPVQMAPRQFWNYEFLVDCVNEIVEWCGIMTLWMIPEAALVGLFGCFYTKCLLVGMDSLWWTGSIWPLNRWHQPSNTALEEEIRVAFPWYPNRQHQAVVSFRLGGAQTRCEW